MLYYPSPLQVYIEGALSVSSWWLNGVPLWFEQSGAGPNGTTGMVQKHM